MTDAALVMLVWMGLSGAVLVVLILVPWWVAIGLAGAACCLLSAAFSWEDA